jgi:hypothetical protein
MARFPFQLRLRPDQIAAYEAAHREVSPLAGEDGGPVRDACRSAAGGALPDDAGGILSRVMRTAQTWRPGPISSGKVGSAFHSFSEPS